MKDDIDPKLFRPGAPLPIIGPQPVQVMVSSLCVNCFPKPKPAIFMWGGFSMCQECFVPRRKYIDENGTHGVVPFVDQRNYKETWGKDPEEDDGN